MRCALERSSERTRPRDRAAARSRGAARELGAPAKQLWPGQPLLPHPRSGQWEREPPPGRDSLCSYVALAGGRDSLYGSVWPMCVFRSGQKEHKLSLLYLNSLTLDHVLGG